MEDNGRKSRLIMVSWVVAMVLGVVACAFFVIQGNARAEALRQEIKSNDEMIEKLGRDLSASEERLANKADVDEDVVLSNATKTGQRIAELQDSFQTAKTDDRSGIAAKIVECVDSELPITLSPRAIVPIIAKYSQSIPASISIEPSPRARRTNMAEEKSIRTPKPMNRPITLPLLLGCPVF